MRLLLKLAVALTATLVVSTALAQTTSLIGGGRGPEPGVNELTPIEVNGSVDLGRAGQRSRKPSLQTRQFDLKVALGCEITGDDLVVVNQGDETLKAGAHIRWQVPGTGFKGYVSLNTDLEAGEGVRADDVLAADLDIEQACAARLI